MFVRSATILWNCGTDEVSRRVFASSFPCRARNFLIALNNALRDGIPRASRSERLFEVAVKRTVNFEYCTGEKEREGEIKSAP